MVKRYAIWNKKDMVYTPSGEAFTPEQWIERYPIAALESAVIVCAANEVNGAIFGVLGQMVQTYEAQGADFSECKTDEEKLEVIEAYEEARAEEARIAAATKAAESERQVVALEAIAEGATSETTELINVLLGEDEIDEAEVI